MIKGWAIYPLPTEGQSNAFDWMVRSALNYSIELEIIFAERLSINVNGHGGVTILYNNREVTPPSFVLMRHYDTRLSYTFEEIGVRVFNSTTSMNLSRDKFLTHLKLNGCNIPTPQTLLGCTYNEAVDKLSLPFVFKSTMGSKGEEVYLISNENEFNDAATTHPNYIVQSYITSSYGRDIRVWVVGDIAVAATLRQNNSSFKSNIAQGGTATGIELTETLSNLAVNSCKALDIELAGVDILLGDNNGFLVCEINGNAGFRAFSIFDDQVDIPNYIFKYIAQVITC